MAVIGTHASPTSQKHTFFSFLKKDINAQELNTQVTFLLEQIKRCENRNDRSILLKENNSIVIERALHRMVACRDANAPENEACIQQLLLLQQEASEGFVEKHKFLAPITILTISLFVAGAALVVVTSYLFPPQNSLDELQKLFSNQQVNFPSQETSNSFENLPEDWQPVHSDPD